MPPKKVAGKKQAMIIDGVNTSEMTRERLEQFTLKVKEELDREREERNYFQQERDKIRTFWDITRAQLEESRAELRNKEREIEEVQEKNEEILETEKQRIKHLQYEQQATAAALRAENLVSLKAAMEDHAQQEAELLKDKRNLGAEMRERDLAAQDELRRTKLNHAEDLHKARTEFEQRVKEIEEKAEKRFKTTNAELTLKHRMEISEIEERKNKQLSDLIQYHDKDFADLKNYYNDITLNNLALLSSLKQQLEGLQAQKERAEKTAADAQAEAKSLREPLEKAVAENKELMRKMGNYSRDKASLSSKTKLLSSVEKQLEVLKYEYEVLQLRFDRVEADRNELRTKFSKAVREVQQRAALKTAVIETRLESMEGKNLMPTQIHELLRMRDTQVEDLRYEAARLRKAHDDLLATYEAKLGVPPEELAFQPLRAIAIQGLDPPVIGRGSAGPVARKKF